MSAVSRSLQILELLSSAPAGLALTSLATTLEIPQSAAHRHLSELIDLGYVRRGADAVTYSLAMKPIAQSLTYLSKIDLIDLAKESVDRLAASSEGLARLAIVGDSRMLWVLKSQGSQSNIRYDPPMNYDVQLSASASAYAWLAQLSDESALELVLAQGIRTEGFGSRAPRTMHDVLGALQETRERGYAMVTDTYEDGITTIAASIVNREFDLVTGVLSIANLTTSMTPDTVARLAPELLAEADRLSEARLDYVRYLLPVGKPSV